MALELKSRTIYNIQSSINSIGVPRRSYVCPISTDLAIGINC